MQSATSYVSAALVIGVLYVISSLFKRSSRLAGLKGPPSPSFKIGNLYALSSSPEVGDPDFRWIREYGKAFRVSGWFGERMLMTADPKALQYIYQTGGYNFPKTDRPFLKLSMGTGILYAHGDDHRRQRKIMLPAFSAPQIRSFLPLFRATATRLSQKWKNMVASGPTEIDVADWLNRATMDALGEAAFDYEFGSIDAKSNEISKVYDNLFIESSYKPTTAEITARGIIGLLPEWFIVGMQFMPLRALQRFKAYTTVTRKVAKRLVDEKSAAVLGSGEKDVMSILVQANSEEPSPKGKLNEDEMLSQMMTLMIAGHETTANTLTWLLWELSKHLEIQKRLFEEIKATRATVAARGDEDFTVADFDGMTYTVAVMKEILRFHPIIFHQFRKAGRDDLIPLSAPIGTEDGKSLSHIPVKKGQKLVLSVCGYNRLPEVWGDDADAFNPERFLNGSVNSSISVGVFANLLTFAGGLRSCIGWRFALIEMQAILVEIVENFHFELPSEDIEIIRAPAGVMTPLVKGDAKVHTRMPILVSRHA